MHRVAFFFIRMLVLLLKKSVSHVVALWDYKLAKLDLLKHFLKLICSAILDQLHISVRKFYLISVVVQYTINSTLSVIIYLLVRLYQ